MATKITNLITPLIFCCASSTEARMGHDHGLQQIPGTALQSESTTVEREGRVGSLKSLEGHEPFPSPFQGDLDSSGLEEILDGTMVDSRTKPQFPDQVSESLGEGEDKCGPCNPEGGFFKGSTEFRFQDRISKPFEEEEGEDQCGSYTPDRALFRGSTEEDLRQALEFLSGSSANSAEMDLAGVMLKGGSKDVADAQKVSENPDVILDIFQLEDASCNFSEEAENLDLVAQVKATAAKGSHLGAWYGAKGWVVHDNFESLEKRKKTFLLSQRSLIWPIGLSKRTPPHLIKTLGRIGFLGN
jgi:hypothetical protein